MAKFLVLYLVPSPVIEAWSKTDPEIKKAAEEKMRDAWGAWMRAHAHMTTGTEAGGKTKRVTPNGVDAVKNDIMIYSFIEAESHEAAAKVFEGHPHLQIPQASIEIMEARPMTGP